MDYSREFLSRISSKKQEISDAYDNGNTGLVDDIRDEIIREMNDHGYTRVPGGMYRTVFKKESNHVVKIANGSLGRSENNSEVYNWNRSQDVPVDDVTSSSATCMARDYLAEIIAYERSRNRGWIVMEFVDDEPDNVSAETANKVQNALAKSGIHIDEIYAANMGRKNGKPVIFDYGGS